MSNVSFHLWKTVLLEKPAEAPAPRARRLRRQKFVLFHLVFVPIWFGVTLLLFQLGLLTEKLSLSSILFVIVTMVLLGTVALWNPYVGCPKCGFNVYFKKDRIHLALYIPSSCPSCGFDLEHLPSNEHPVEQAT